MFQRNKSIHKLTSGIIFNFNVNYGNVLIDCFIFNDSFSDQVTYYIHQLCIAILMHQIGSLIFDKFLTSFSFHSPWKSTGIKKKKNDDDSQSAS